MLFIYLTFILVQDGQSENLTVLRIRSSQFDGALPRIWESTGMSPGEPHSRARDTLLSTDMRINLANVGSMGFSKETQVRVHWLLDLVKVVNTSAYGDLNFDFTDLDEFLGLLKENNLKPGFEMMGNPSDVFTDFQNETQRWWLLDLTQQIAMRYVKKYGIEYVSRWNFETWNEPDHEKTWDPPLNAMTTQKFLSYFDIIRLGLRKFNGSLRLGGPGGACRPPHFMEYCGALLKHCDKGAKVNRRCLDFISFHKKGARKGGIVSSRSIIAQEKSTISMMAQAYPHLASLPIFNDEGDPEVGWSEPRPWRADVTYAAIAVKILEQHLRAYEHSGVDFQLLSNDNAFLSYVPYQFEQRTLLARFQMNSTISNEGSASKTSWVQFFIKPIYAALTMMSYSYESKIVVESSRSNGIVGGIASIHYPETMLAHRRDSPQMTAIVYVSNDTQAKFVAKQRVRVEIELPARWVEDRRNLKIIEISLCNDDWRGNPYPVWVKMGKPSYPDYRQSQNIRSFEAPALTMIDGNTAFQGNTFYNEFAVDAPAVKLYHICRRSILPPGKPAQLRVTPISPLSCSQDHNNCHQLVIITWNSTSIGTKCVLRYEVVSHEGRLIATTKSGSAPIFSHIVVAFENVLQGTSIKVSVRAVDYFWRKGLLSDAVSHKFD